MVLIRTSDRIAYKRCRRQWDLSSPLRQSLAPKSLKPAFYIGSAVHAGLEGYYDPSSPRTITPMMDKYFAYCFEEEKKVTGNELSTMLEAYIKLRELGADMLAHYMKWAQLHDDFTVLLVEKEYRIPIPGTDHHYGGKLDSLVQDESEKFWVLEHKTANRLPGNTDWLEMDEQLGSYLWLVQKDLGIEIEGVIYNVLLKELPKPARELKDGGFSMDKSQHTTAERYEESLIQKLGHVPERYNDFLAWFSSQPNKFFHREKIRRNKNEIKELDWRIKAEAEEMVDSPVIYPNPNRFHCDFCDFREVCLAISDGSDAAGIINENFNFVSHEDQHYAIK